MANICHNVQKWERIPKREIEMKDVGADEKRKAKKQ